MVIEINLAKQPLFHLYLKNYIRYSKIDVGLKRGFYYLKLNT